MNGWIASGLLAGMGFACMGFACNAMQYYGQGRAVKWWGIAALAFCVPLVLRLIIASVLS